MLIERWLWGGRSLAASMARCALLPASGLYWGFSAVRVAAYRWGMLRSASVTVPTVAIGNLVVGGTGKTPLAAWVANHFVRRGVTPGILLRGYGGDEGAIHRKLVPGAIVLEGPDRVARASEAISRGAEVIVLDDAYQRLDIDRDLNIAVVSAESATNPRWTLPAGPWREGWRALRRADLVVVSRKRSGVGEAEAVSRRVERKVDPKPVAVVRLAISGFHGLRSGETVDASELSGTRVLVAAGIADPDTLAEQCRGLGAEVRLIPWRDHYVPSVRDVDRVILDGREADFVVTTEKDAVKLVDLWPEGADEPIVADLIPAWDRGVELVEQALDDVISVGRMYGRVA